MTDYADLKVAPSLRRVMETAAEAQYGQQYRAISRAGHEAGIVWLMLAVDDDHRQDALAAHGFEDIQDLIDHLVSGDDGRFSEDAQFDPLRAIRTPRQMATDGSGGGGD